MLWVVELDYLTNEPLSIAELEKIDREGDPRGWYTGPLPDRAGIRVSAYVESEDPWDAGAKVMPVLEDWLRRHGLGPLRRAKLRVLSEEDYDAEATRPDTPELLSAADVADVLDVSRQRVHQLATSHPRFPEPYVRLATGPIWTLPVIERFRDTWDRRPGRRRRTAVG